MRGGCEGRSGYEEWSGCEGGVDVRSGCEEWM